MTGEDTVCKLYSGVKTSLTTLEHKCEELGSDMKSLRTWIMSLLMGLLLLAATNIAAMYQNQNHTKAIAQAIAEEIKNQ